MKTFSLRSGFVAIVAVAAHAYGAPLPTPGCTSGTPASLSEQPDTFQVFPISASPGAATVQFGFYVRDAAGHPLAGASVDFSLPASAPSGTFGSGSASTGFTPSPTPLVASATTDSNCVGITPLFVAGTQLGTFSLVASVAGASGITLSIPVTVAAPSTSGISSSRVLHLAGGSSVTPPLEVSVMSGFNPVAGVAVTFTAPENGPSFSFANGTHSTVAITDAFGVARAAPIANNIPGQVKVQASLAAGTSVLLDNYVIPGPLQIVADSTTRYTFGERRSIGYRVLAPWFPCNYESQGMSVLGGGSATLSANGLALVTTTPSFGFCNASGFVIDATADVSALLPGAYDLDALYGAPHGLGLVEARGRLNVDPDVSLDASNGAGPYRFAVGWTVSGTAEGTCSTVKGTTGRPGDGGFPPTAPPGLDVPAGLLRIDATNCAWGPVFDLLPVGTLVQKALLGTGSPLSPGTTVWAWGPTADNPAPHWYMLSTGLNGTFASFDLVDGGPGDNSIGQDNQLHAVLALTQPPANDFSRGVQDLWWAGPPENGWGLSLTQHDDRLFAGLFIYDATGAPTWLVMSSGTWNGDHTQYSGSLYRPHGSAFNAYDATRFSPGPAVGTLTLTFTARDTLTLEYTIDGVGGRKSMQRQLFGPVDPLYPPAVSDLWWGGPSQNGWGLAIAQQYSTAFGVLFTYDANGNPVWFPLPALRGNASAVASDVYRTLGAPWVGASYDASRFSATDIGHATLTFDATGAFLSYTIGGLKVEHGLSRQPF